MKMSYILAVACALLAFLFFVFFRNRESINPFGSCDMATLHLGESVFDIEFAKTREEHELGLSYRSQFPVEKGMLFIFPSPSFQYFWMKDMNFPIHIFWISKDMQVVGVVPFADPQSYPKHFVSPSPVQFVLEVSSAAMKEPEKSVGRTISMVCKKTSPRK